MTSVSLFLSFGDCDFLLQKVSENVILGYGTTKKKGTDPTYWHLMSLYCHELEGSIKSNSVALSGNGGKMSAKRSF